jgi:hypothetical protein
MRVNAAQVGVQQNVCCQRSLICRASDLMTYLQGEILKLTVGIYGICHGLKIAIRAILTVILKISAGFFNRKNSSILGGVLTGVAGYFCCLCVLYCRMILIPFFEALKATIIPLA